MSYFDNLIFQMITIVTPSPCPNIHLNKEHICFKSDLQNAAHVRQSEALNCEGSSTRPITGLVTDRASSKETFHLINQSTVLQKLTAALR